MNDKLHSDLLDLLIDIENILNNDDMSMWERGMIRGIHDQINDLLDIEY